MCVKPSTVLTGYLYLKKILSIDAVPQTVKRFSRFELGPLTPNLKLGENEKFNFSYGL